MSYSLNDVFYLDQQFDLASPAVNTETGKTLDISSYIEPTPSSGSGTGLAIYKVHFDWSATTGNTVVGNDEKGSGRAAIIVGNIGFSGTTALAAMNDFTLSNSNANLVASQDFYGPQSGDSITAVGQATPGMAYEMEIQMPSTEVPFVAVRDTLNLVWGQSPAQAGTTTTNISVRLEVAKVKLSARIMNQLLRTQTA
jgi:hypothetical protein